MKVAIYMRVSTTKQDTLNQELQLKKYCEKQLWGVTQIYKETISGKETSRPQFDFLFQDAHKKLFDMVLFWDLSRFSRAGTYHTLMKLKELDNLNIEWHSYNEPYVSSIGQFKDVVIAVLASVAKAEREKISQRTIAGLERAKSQGKKLGKRKINLTINDERLILQEYIKQGSINKTAKIFKGRWSYGFIYDFLSNKGGISKA
jgi:putative DNA-invertase from lambdoid prophage Rac